MRAIRRYFAVEPIGTPGASAVAYVPVVMMARGLAFLRTLVVARILGEAGKGVFGVYQPALELVNPIVALVLFGASDVAERYVAGVEREHGRRGVLRWIGWVWVRLFLNGLSAAAIMMLASPW